VLACLANEDAGELAAKEHVDKGEQLVIGGCGGLVGLRPLGGFLLWRRSLLDDL